MHGITAAQRKTGQRDGWPFHWWVTISFPSSFFCILNVLVMELARGRHLPKWLSSLWLRKKRTPFSLIISVCRGPLTVLHSQDLQAKKKVVQRRVAMAWSTSVMVHLRSMSSCYGILLFRAEVFIFHFLNLLV